MNEQSQKNQSKPAVAPSALTDVLAALSTTLEIERQEAFCKGIEYARDIAWNQHKHHGRDNATAYQVHEAIFQNAVSARRVLDELKAANYGGKRDDD